MKVKFLFIFGGSVGGGSGGLYEFAGARGGGGDGAEGKCNWFPRGRKNTFDAEAEAVGGSGGVDVER